MQILFLFTNLELPRGLRLMLRARYESKGEGSKYRSRHSRNIGLGQASGRVIQLLTSIIIVYLFSVLPRLSGPSNAAVVFLGAGGASFRPEQRWS